MVTNSCKQRIANGIAKEQDMYMNHLNFSWVIEGKLAGHQAPLSEEDLLWLKKQGILSLVRMVEKIKTEVTSPQVLRHGFRDCYEPVPDFHSPRLTQINKIIRFITVSLSDGRPVGVSCWAGLGRTGTILACFLVSQGYSAGTAIYQVRAKRPGSIETMSQEEAVKAYAEQVGLSN